MKNDSAITLKSFKVFKVNHVVEKFSIYNRKIRERMLKSYVEIKLDILSFEVLHNTQYLKFIFYITFQHSFMNVSLLNTEFF